jgi:hypothetical protein
MVDKQKTLDDKGRSKHIGRLVNCSEKKEVINYTHPQPQKGKYPIDYFTCWCTLFEKQKNYGGSKYIKDDLHRIHRQVIIFEDLQKLLDSKREFHFRVA